jgi:hypothetical protein
MGAALTYTRRYALFTLVGIVGEDDLDAPDMAVSAGPRASVSPSSVPAGNRTRATIASRAREARKAVRLTPEASARLRDQLTVEVEQFRDANSLTTWVYRALPLKAQLSIADAQAVEAAFDAKLRLLKDAQTVSAAKEKSPLATACAPRRAESRRRDSGLT